MISITAQLLERSDVIGQCYHASIVSHSIRLILLSLGLDTGQKKLSIQTNSKKMQKQLQKPTNQGAEEVH